MTAKVPQSNQNLKLIETEIGTIASDWKVVPLSKVADKPQYGLTASAAKSGNVQFLRITDITSRGVNWETVPFCSASIKKIDPCRLKSGDIVFARIGATTGKSYLISDPPESVFASYLIRVRAGEELDPSFLIHYFQSSGYWTQVDANKHASLKMGINGSILNKLLLPLPPLPEQKKIAHILSTVQRAIEAQERIIQTTTELKKALMHKLFTEGLRNEPQKQTEIGPTPRNWDLAPLEAKAESFQYGTSVKCCYKAEGKPVLRIPNVVGGHVDPTDLKFGKPKSNEVGKLTLQPGDLLFVRTNGVKENAGRCSKFNGELEDCYFASYLIRVRLDPQIMNADFVSEYSRTEMGTSLLSGRSIRTADGKFNINSGTLKTLLVPVPAIDEQEEIAKTFRLIDKKAASTQAKKTNFEGLFRTLLHQLMTGKLRPQ